MISEALGGHIFPFFGGIIDSHQMVNWWFGFLGFPYAKGYRISDRGSPRQDPNPLGPKLPIYYLS